MEKKMETTIVYWGSIGNNNGNYHNRVYMNQDHLGNNGKEHGGNCYVGFRALAA